MKTKMPKGMKLPHYKANHPRLHREGLSSKGKSAFGAPPAMPAFGGPGGPAPAFGGGGGGAPALDPGAMGAAPVAPGGGMTGG